jgi:hypothetical protein
MERRRLNLLRMKEQGGLRPLCNEVLPERGAVIEPTRAIDRFMAASTRLIELQRDTAQQAAK